MDHHIARRLWPVLGIALLLGTACAGAASEAPPPVEVEVEEPAPVPEEAAPAEVEVAEDVAEEEPAAELVPCSALAQISSLQTPVPVTEEPAQAPPPTEAPAEPPPPTATPRPAPSVDRVGFPEGYPDDYHVIYVYDRVGNGQVRVICGNDAAAASQPGEPYPHGSILVMETWRTARDESGSVLTDEDGRFVRSSLFALFVMRKEEGFGEAYEDLRTGEWEYAAYFADGRVLVPPENTANCAACHLGAREDKDWVFRGDLFHTLDRYAQGPMRGETEVNIESMSFGPRQLTVPVGTEVTWFNDDVVGHTVAADDASVNSGLLDSGDDFTFTFDEPGEFTYHCAIHPDIMTATIVVE